MWISDRISEVCVDDFALRKRETYGTVIIDSRTHRVVDMIDSRERTDVAKKLMEYPNLKVVSRDGSPTYAAAISDAGDDIMQISDRFHLLKGLTDACKQVLQRLFKANIAVEKKDVAEEVPSAYNSSYWEKDAKKDFAERTHEKNLAKKKERIELVRGLAEKGLRKSEIAKETGISYQTVARYLKEDFDPESAGYGRKHASPIKPFEETIKEMLVKKRTFREIEKELRSKGYKGAASTIRMYATRERRLLKQAAGLNRDADILERKWLVKLLYKTMDELKEADQELIGRLLEEYPIVQDIYDLVGSFREILFSKKPDDIDKWLAEADNMDIDEITSFANGLRRDLQAVKNAAGTDYNNGLAEGTVNKIKLAKRKMYGRCCFETLRKKVLLREQYKIIQQT